MEKALNIEMWEKWFNFRTLGDRQLTAMLLASARFVLDIRGKRNPRWLTLLGSSGAGKTYLIKRIHRWIVDTRQFGTETLGDEIIYGHDFVYWPKSAQALQQRLEPDEIYNAPRVKFLALDELGGVRDSTGFVTSRLSVMLGQRMGKWTVITSNLTLEQIGERIDPRVASRIIRDGNKIVEVDVTDYALRSI